VRWRISRQALLRGLPIGAESELIVHSNHGAQYNPEAMREAERILKENLAANN
jgi:hypothetical protein